MKIRINQSYFTRATVWAAFLLPLISCSSSKPSLLSIIRTNSDHFTIGEERSPTADLAEEQAQQSAPNQEVKTWRRSTLVANTSRLMIGDHEELPIKGMQVHARVDGFKARVLMDLYFENPHTRAYEGTFKIRMPNEGTPYFFAFGQANGELIQGRSSRILQIATDTEEPNASRVSRLASSEAVRAQSLEPLAIMRERSDAWSAPKEARMVPREQAAFAYTSTVR